MRYDFELFDLTIDKIEEQLDCFVELNQDHVHYRLEAYINKTPLIGDEHESFDDRQGVYVFEELYFKREDLKSIERVFINTEEMDLYTVSLIFPSVGEPLQINFKSDKKSEEFLKLCVDYFLDIKVEEPK